MNAVYDLSDGRKLMMYMENNRILLLFTPMRPGSMPYVRHKDCLGNLSSIVWRGRIYYAYENFSRQIIFGCLDEPHTQILLSPFSENQWFENPILHQAGDDLYLFYVQCLDNGQRYFYMRSPWNTDRVNLLWQGEEHSLYAGWYRHHNKSYMDLRRGHEVPDLSRHKQENTGNPGQKNGVVRSFVWNGEKGIYEADEKEGEACGESCEKAEEFFKEKARLQKENEALKKALSEAVGEKEKFEKMCAQKDTMLESARSQYDQLARTARDLQKIGRQWRDKYIESKKN